MRVLLVSDTHATLHPEVEALAVKADLVLHAGDVGSAEVLKRLGPVRAVTGNNDTAAKWQGAKAKLQALDDVLNVELPSGTVVVEHGHHALPASPRHERLRARHPDARLIVYGHSHRQVLDQDASPWVVNPGAAGRVRTYGGASCVLLLASERRWTLKPYRF